MIRTAPCFPVALRVALLVLGSAPAVNIYQQTRAALRSNGQVMAVVAALFASGSLFAGGQILRPRTQEVLQQ